MKHIASLGKWLDVHEAQQELASCNAWNLHRFRTEHPRSPHREVDDIWLRYNALENFGPHFNDPHESVWYPIADSLPAIKTLVQCVLDEVDAPVLGGVLVTRLPVGKQVYPHIDRGWHAEHYRKFAVLIEGNEEQSFCFDDGALHCTAGELFEFNNQACHWVMNPSKQDRITLIVCARRN